VSTPASNTTGARGAPPVPSQPAQSRNPSFRLRAVLLAALSLSIGWGIRGNYGHEAGAMFPGAITAIAVCLVSGREDWRQRVAYFALFGALGWAFGGSISYMHAIAYTHSGQYESQLYGFYALFLIGFLWAALGGAGTALPAVLDRGSLTEMFKPLALLIALWALMYFALEPIENRFAPVPDGNTRQASPLYWLDSDWLTAAVILAGILLFDLVDRRFQKIAHLVVLAAFGAALGFAAQWALKAAGATEQIGQWLFHYYGYGDAALNEGHTTEFVTNWPNFLPNVVDHVGWVVGLIVGVGIYFSLYGAFRRGSSLFLHMAVGWFAAFVVLPVILDLRLTPPRGDSWAGILGVYLGAIVYLFRRRLTAVVLASIVCGTIGGIGFSGAAWSKLLLVSLGNPNLAQDVAAIEAWRHWQSANWHSYLEQSYGFVNGLGVIVALGLLARCVPPLDNSAPRRPWTEVFAIIMALPVLTYINMVKNLDEWTALYAGHQPVPDVMQAPLWDRLELSAFGWFNVFFWAMSLALVAMVMVHFRRPLAIVPSTWLGRGQLLYVVILWTFIIGNFVRALTSFAEGRLLTEGTVLVNAVIATVLLLVTPRTMESFTPKPVPSFGGRLVVAMLVALLAAAAIPPLETMSVRRVYGDAFAGHAGQIYRFGENATWRTAPILKTQPHR